MSSKDGGGGGGRRGGGEGSGVSIPASIKKTIQSIKEITGKLSDEEIYAVLEECSMDPYESAQKLLYLDTFHQVKSQRYRKKEVEGPGVLISANAKEMIQSIREIVGMQHSDEDIYAVLKECSMDPNETAQKLLYLDTFHEVKSKNDRKMEVIEIAAGHARVYTTTRYVGWSPPEEGWVKLNTDGCCKGSNQLAGGGGLLRDMHGAWLMGFTYNIGICNALDAELWAVLQGLKLAWSKGFRRVVLEVDSEAAVKSLTDNIKHRPSMVNLLGACRQEIGRQWEVKVMHVYREGNKAADFLASASLQHDYGLKVLESPPLGLQQLLLDDAMGLVWPRTVPVPGD